MYLKDRAQALQAVKTLIENIGEDPNRSGLLETPDRVVRSWDELFSGYGQHPRDVLKCFQEESSDEMIVLKDIEMYSTCEHHMLPFWGKAHVAYIPNHKIVGASKLARLVEIFSRRLQIQERICEQVSNSLMCHVDAKGAACFIEAKHFCISSRGVQKQESVFVTSSLKGIFLTDQNVRNELFALVGRK